MGAGPPFDVSAEQYHTILTLLRQHLPNTSACAYGSGSARTSSPRSDLDLVVFTTPEQHHQVGALREAVEESSLLFRVDLFVWDDIPDSCRKNVCEHHVELMPGRKETSSSVAP